MSIKSKAKETGISEKLEKLASLQQIHTKIDQIHVLKGELPIEVSDLEDDIAGMQIRINKIKSDLESLNEETVSRRNSIKESEALILKYDKQINAVKNNREFDALTKEI